MSRHTLFLTGHLAEKRLRDVLDGIGDLDFAWTVHDIGVQVAALMTADLIRRRLPKDALGADRIIVPGHCQGDLAGLGGELGVAVERGPTDLHDCPPSSAAPAKRSISTPMRCASSPRSSTRRSSRSMASWRAPGRLPPTAPR